MSFISFSGLAAVVAPASLIVAAPAASSVITNTASETTFDNTGQSIPANALKAGDVIDFFAQGIVVDTNAGNVTLTVKFKLGSTVIIATSAVDVENNDIFIVKGRIQIRTIGASGTMVAAGEQIVEIEGTSLKGWKLASTALDTTAAIAMNLTATWGSAASDCDVRCDVFTVHIHRTADQMVT